MLADSGEAFIHLRIVAAAFKSHLRPAEDCADHVVEIVRDAASELADGLEFLRLPQLPLKRAQFGHVFRDYLKRVRILISAQSPQVETHGQKPAVGALPFRLRAVNLAGLAARRHQPRILFREAEQIARKVQSVHAVVRRAAQHAAQRGICIEKRAIARHARNSVNRVFDQAAISRF